MVGRDLKPCRRLSTLRQLSVFSPENAQYLMSQKQPESALDRSAPSKLGMCCAEPEKAENATEKGKEVFMGGLPQIILFAGILSLGGMLANLGRSDVQEISFQHFKTHLLAQGLVEKVEVANKTSAKVYVRAGSARCETCAGCQCVGAPLQ